MHPKSWRDRDMLSRARHSCDANDLLNLSEEVGAIAGSCVGNDPVRMQCLFAGGARKSKEIAAKRGAIVVWLREEWCCTCYTPLHKRRILPRNVVEAEGLGRWKPLSWPIISVVLGLKNHTSALLSYRRMKRRSHDTNDRPVLSVAIGSCH